MTTATMTVKVLGISDDVTTCECCGRTYLKRTVALDFNGQGMKHYGTTCAAKALKANFPSAAKGTLIEQTAKVISYAAKWIAERGNKYAEDRVWNCFGHLCEAKKDGTLVVKTAFGLQTVAG